MPLKDLKRDSSTVHKAGGLGIEYCDTPYHVDYLINLPVLKGPCQTGTVSYTHLDVYKRQVLMAVILPQNEIVVKFFLKFFDYIKFYSSAVYFLCITMRKIVLFCVILWH